MPRRESESRFSSTAGATSAPSAGLRRGRSRSPCRDRRRPHDYVCSDRSSPDSSGSERSGRDRRHRRRRRKSRGRSKQHRRCHRSRDTETSSESDSDDDSDTSYYESEGSRDRKRKRSKSHKNSKRSTSRKSTSRKTRKGGSRRKRSTRSDSEDSGTPAGRAAANAKSNNVAETAAKGRSQQQPALDGEAPARNIDAAVRLRKENQVHSAEDEGKRSLAEFNNHGEKAGRERESTVREGLGRHVDSGLGKGPDDVEIKRFAYWPNILRSVRES